MKKNNLKIFAGIATIFLLVLLAFRWFIPLKSFHDGDIIAAVVMTWGWMFGSSASDITKRNLKAVMGLLLFASCGALNSHGSYAGFSFGIIVTAAIYFVAPFLGDMFENYLKASEARGKAREARRTPEERMADQAKVEAALAKLRKKQGY